MNMSVTGFFDLPLDVRRQVYRRARFLETKERVEGLLQRCPSPVMVPNVFPFCHDVRFQISAAGNRWMGICKWVGDKVFYAVYHGTWSERVRLRLRGRHDGRVLAMMTAKISWSHDPLYVDVPQAP